ncbi:hypothetical protein [Pseudogemmobacter sonorensis]|uniref:hypothetical protein n=1 Tax=Pseudogemmobacter sonorensis TaxID=2989681 RepID=UPI0036935EAE
METHSITWRGIAIRINFTPQAFGLVDHIELHSTGEAALPVTETGYRSHFIPAGSVAAYGGAVAFVTAWLDHEAKRTPWCKPAPQQLSLF